MKKEISQDKKRFVFFLAMLILGTIGIIIYSALTGNTNQVFTDVVNEITALTGSNKSAEKNMYYIFSIFGAVIIFVYYLLVNRKNIHTQYVEEKGTYVLVVLGVFLATGFLFYNSTIIG